MVARGSRRMKLAKIGTLTIALHAAEGFRVRTPLAIVRSRPTCNGRIASMATRAKGDEYDLLGEEPVERPRSPRGSSHSNIMAELDSILNDVAGDALGLDDFLGPAPGSRAPASRGGYSTPPRAPAGGRNSYDREPSYGGDRGRSSDTRGGYNDRDRGYNGSGGGRGGRGGGYGGRGGYNDRAPWNTKSAPALDGEKLLVDLDIEVSAIEDKDVDEQTLNVLRTKGITHYTPVQSQTYDHILKGRDMVAKSRTGTGKTIAFGLPVIQHLARYAENHENATSVRGRMPRMIVMCPTRELAKQVAEELTLLGRPHGLIVECFYGGSSYSPQENALRRGIDIMVGTPGRTLDLIDKGHLDLSAIRHAVLDEADEMLNMGFSDDIEDLFGRMQIEKCQVLLFSATVPDWVKNMSAKYLKNPLQVDAVGTDDNKLATTVTHLAIETPGRNRAHILEDIIAVYGKGSRAIVFTQTKRECDELAAGNAFKTLSSQVLHGDIGQNQREVTIGQFRKSQFQVLVATDVAARGIDISEIDLVVQYRPPTDPDTYVHRSGRTGRAGRSGTCVTLFSEDEYRDIIKIERAVGKGFKFTRGTVPSPAQVMNVAGNVAVKQLNTVSDAIIPYFAPAARELLETYQTEQGEAMDMETLLAKCLAAISRKTDITQTSLLTGEPDMATVQMTAPRPLAAGDVMYAVNKLGRAGGLENKIGKISVARDARVAVFDMPSASAIALCDFAASQSLSSISFKLCTQLPDLPAQREGDRMGRGGRGGRSSGRGGNRFDRDSSGGGRGGGGYRGDRDRRPAAGPYGGGHAAARRESEAW